MVKEVGCRESRHADDRLRTRD